MIPQSETQTFVPTCRLNESAAPFGCGGFVWGAQPFGRCGPGGEHADEIGRSCGLRRVNAMPWTLLFICARCLIKSGAGIGHGLSPNDHKTLPTRSKINSFRSATRCVRKERSRFGTTKNEAVVSTTSFSLLAVRRGLEPLTPCVTGTYSNRLN